ncbi:MAG TPA: hypothetical protein VJL29_09855 [Thermoguttaceae bacterium]|nr:hypothetical protein [Thermoguttaceae bacterium]
MSDKPQHTITIWFFVGGLFTIYGILIILAGLFIESPEYVKMQHVHVRIWWGAILLVMGLIFTIRFWPRKEQLTGGDGVKKK